MKPMIPKDKNVRTMFRQVQTSHDNGQSMVIYP